MSPAAQAAPTRISTRRSGFTLIELLTVVAIIGILAAILIPTIGKIQESARRSRCSSNLHQIGVGLLLYRGENRGAFPANVSGHWITATLRDSLAHYGVPWEALFCPSNTVYSDQYMTNSQRTQSVGEVAIGYLYIPGLSGTFNRTIEPLGYKILMVDLARRYAGSWERGVNHGSLAPDGANHLLTDGSVRWLPASDFINDPPFNVIGTDHYFKRIRE